MDEAPAPAGGDAPPAGGAPGAFDPAVFQTNLMVEVNKAINGMAKGLKTDFTKMFQASAPVVVPPVVEPPDPALPGKSVDPQLNALMLEYKKSKETADARILALETGNREKDERVERTERESQVRAAINSNPKLKFTSEAAAATAFAILSPQIKRTEDGALVANDLPFEKFIEAELLGTHAYLLTTKEVGGAGGRGPGKGTPGESRWGADPRLHLEPAKFSKLTPAEQTEVRQAVMTMQ
jgi:hypothetical protein